MNATDKTDTEDPLSESEDARNLGIFNTLYAYLTGERKGLPPPISVRPVYPDRDESLRGSPYTLDLSPNPALPPLERALQAVLLRVIVEFGGIARDLDYLGSSKNGDYLSRYGEMLSDAHTCAFTQTIESSWGKWL